MANYCCQWFCVYLLTHWIPHALGCRAYISVWRGKRRILCGVFFSSPSPLLLSTVYQRDGCLSSLGSGAHSWVCKVLPTISAVSIFEHVAKSGSTHPPHSNAVVKIYCHRLQVQTGRFEALNTTKCNIKSESLEANGSSFFSKVARQWLFNTKIKTTN